MIDGRYRVEQLAGKGGMGHVYRCLELTTRTRVAVKLLTRTTEESERRFSLEIEILSGLALPNVVRYLSNGYHEGAPYLVMEWLSGESLGQRLSRAPLKVSEALDVALHCALALAPIHAAGVIHRDIKPSNIFLLDKSTSEIKLLDFGIARLLSKDADVTKTGLLLGSPGYLAPEQARGDKKINASADVFALGSVLFECLTGRPPFIAGHSIAVLVKVLFEEVPKLREFRPLLPASLEALLDKMLSKSPAERYADGAQVAEALTRLEAFDEQSTNAAASLVPALTHQEQRLLGVILLLGVFQPSSFESTSATGDIPTIVREEAATHISGDNSSAVRDASKLVLLREHVGRFDGRAEPLADGSMVVSIAAPGEAIDQATQAARCALALRKLLPQAPISLALGLGALSPSPFGEVVDRAAGLLSASPSATSKNILIDETTAALIEQRFHVRRSARGATLEAERSAESSARTLLGRPSPFVGRDDEVRLVEERFYDCVETSSPRVLLFKAPAGIGKSRLRAECTRDLPALCLSLRGDSVSTEAPFSMISRALREISLVQEQDSAEERYRKVSSFVTRRLETVTRNETYSTARRLAEFLGELAQTPSTTPSVPLRTARQEPSLMADQTRRAFIDWLIIEMGNQPVCLIIEDLHWGDVATIRLVLGALRASEQAPLFVLLFTRPEARQRHPELWELPNLEEVSLPPLSRGACQAFIQATLGSQISAAQREELFETAQGNAFYLEELLREMSLGARSLPGSIIAMAQARVDNLPEASRHVLRAASVFGERFSLAALAPMLKGLLHERALTEQLRDLVEQEVLSYSAQEQFQFRHSLVREAAYAKLTPHDRALAHRFAAQWLSEQSSPEPVVVAEHWRQGEEPKLAASWYVRAAKAALEANDLHGAVSLSELAERFGLDGDLGASLHQIKAEAYGWLGEPKLAINVWGEFLPLVPRGSSAWYNAHAALFMSSLQLRDFERALEIVELLQTTTPPPEALVESSMSLAIVVSFACVGGLYQVASSFIEKFNHFGGGTSEAEGLIAAGWKNQAYAYGALYLDGDPWEYLQRSQVAMRHFERAGHLRGAMTQAAEVGRAYLGLGAYERAERFLREKLQQIEQLQLHYIRPFVKLYLAQSLRSQQRYQEAIPFIEEAMQEFAKTNHGPKQGDSRAELGKIFLEQNELSDADTQLQKALQFLAFALPAKSKATAISSLIRLSQGKPGEALELSQEALDLLDGLGGKGYDDVYLRWAHIEALLANKRLAEAKDFIYETKRRIVQRAERITDFNFRESFVRGVEENRKVLSLAHQFQL